MTAAPTTTLFNLLLWDWLGLDQVLDRPRYKGHDRATIEAMLEMAQRFSDDMLAPSARAVDADPPRLGQDGGVHVHPASAAALHGLAENGFFATVFDEQAGGLQLPQMVHLAMLGLSMGGCAATASYLLLTVGNARLIVEKGTPEQITAFALPQIAGTALGTMCLSEPHAGSALGAITTQAAEDGEDALGRRYRIRGSKMWISAADQNVTDNIIHLVLAKAPDATGAVLSGTRGISLFIVPKRLPDGGFNDITITGLNHKLGQRALPNCAMTFGEGRFIPEGKAGAVGWLLGEVGEGLPQMFQMMNDARVAVGMSGAMLSLRGYQLSLAYAFDRVQGHVGGRPAAIVEHADVKRLLLSQKATAEGALALVLFGARLLDDEQTAVAEADRQAAGKLLGLLTPAIKSWPSEFGQEALHNAMQVLGGAGYTSDHEIEKLWRDNRLNPIHEGTTGIQAIDLADRKIRRDGGRSFAALAERIDATIAATAEIPQLRVDSTAVNQAMVALRAAIEAVIAQPDEAVWLSWATPLLNAFGHVVVAWLWLDQMRVAVATPSACQSGRQRTLRYFTDYELPRVRQWLHPIEQRSSAVAEMALDEF